MILNGISLAIYINGSMISTLICLFRSWKKYWVIISIPFMQWSILWARKNYSNHIWENGLMKRLKQQSGKYISSFMSTQLLLSEPLEQKSGNGKRSHYNLPFVRYMKNNFKMGFQVSDIWLHQFWFAGSADTCDDLDIKDRIFYRIKDASNGIITKPDIINIIQAGESVPQLFCFLNFLFHGGWFNV